jgi:protein-tyrosine phosphatase
MFLIILKLTGIIIVCLLLLAIGILIYQASAPKRPFEEVFAYDNDESVQIIENPTSGFQLKWTKEVQPQKISVSDFRSPNNFAHGVTIPADERQTYIPRNEPLIRHYFNFEYAHHNKIYSNRDIQFEKIRNFRDIGGYQNTSGQSVRWGQLFRSAALGRASESDLTRLKALDIQTVIDLRWNQERLNRPDPEIDSITNLALEIMEKDPIDRAFGLFRRRQLRERFIRMYTLMIIDEGAEKLGEAITILSQPENLPAVFHCTAGKDRTGVLAALILAVLGIPESVIIRDYNISNAYARLGVEEVAKSIERHHWLGMRIEHLYPLLTADPFYLKTTFRHISEQYGTVENYLTNQAKVAPETLERLRNNLLVD